MAFWLVQLLTGLAGASSLFLVAAGLTVIFGVTRIVNFAHGSLAMLGAYVGWTILVHLPRDPASFVLGVIAASIAIGVLGALLEVALLRRLYRAPELFQLLATFAIVLMVQDVVLRIWGPEDLTVPRPRWLRGFVLVLGERFPTYDLALIAIGPLVLAALFLLLHRTRWGRLVRAATQDREMLGALGVDQRLLFTSVLALGAGLAGFAGVLSLPEGSANLGIDLATITDAFVVVVVGGLGSVAGAYLAAVLIGVLQALGIVLIPKATLVLAFAVMAAVLVVRPNGLLGRAAPSALAPGQVRTVRPPGAATLTAWGAVLLAALAAPFVLGPYGISILIDMAVAVLFAGSLHFMMGPGGMASFGHAAWFGIGAYATALAASMLAAPMPLALVAAPLVAGGAAFLFGAVVVRLSGVYLAMLTLAFAQIVWALASQCVGADGRRQRNPRHLAAARAGRAGRIRAAGHRALRRRHVPAAARAACAIRVRAPRVAGFGAAGGGNRARHAAAAPRGLHGRRRRGGAIRRVVRLCEGQRVPDLCQHSALRRCAGDGAARRRADHGRPGDRRHRLYRSHRPAAARHRRLALPARRRDPAAGAAFPPGHRRRGAGARRGMSLLVVEDLRKAFGGVLAVDSLSFALAPGEMLAMIGPNGAGKSTSFAMLGGQLRPDAGRVLLAGRNIAGLPARAVSRLGRRPHLPDHRDLRLHDRARERADGADRASPREWRLVARRRALAMSARRMSLLAQVGLAEQAARGAGILAYGDLKRLELAMALAGGPRLLLMDEPTAGMAPGRTRRADGAGARARARARHRRAVHRARHGRGVRRRRPHPRPRPRRLIAAGSPDEIRADPRVRAVYLGDAA